MNTGRRPAILSDRSMNTAVEPVTRAVAPVPAVAFGRTVSRRRFTNVEVAAASGADLGTADSRSVRPDGLTVGGLTVAMPGSAATAGVMRATTVLLSLCPGSSTTSVRGPLNPGPNAFDRR